MAPQDKQKRKGSGNRLKDDTPFTCSVHFRADLPEASFRSLGTPLSILLRFCGNLRLRLSTRRLQALPECLSRHCSRKSLLNFA